MAWAAAAEAAAFLSSRGTANVLTRSTAILAALFFCTSLFLSWHASLDRKPRSILDGGAPAAPAAPSVPGGGGGGACSNQLGGGSSRNSRLRRRRLPDRKCRGSRLPGAG